MPTKTKKKKKASKKKAAKKKASPAKVKKKESVYDRAQRQVEADNKTYQGGAEFFKVPGGKTWVRLFTFDDEEGLEQVYVKKMTHWNLDPDSSFKLTCIGKDCPVCAERKNTPEDLWKGRNGIQAKPDYLVNAIIRGEGQMEDEQVILQTCKTVIIGDSRQGKEITGIMGYIDTLGEIFDHKKGYDFMIYKRGSGLNTIYKISHKPKPSKLDFDVDPVDLSKFLKPPTDESIDEALAFLQGRVA